MDSFRQDDGSLWQLPHRRFAGYHTISRSSMCAQGAEECKVKSSRIRPARQFRRVMAGNGSRRLGSSSRRLRHRASGSPSISWPVRNPSANDALVGPAGERAAVQARLDLSRAKPC